MDGIEQTIKNSQNTNIPSIEGMRLMEDNIETRLRCQKIHSRPEFFASINSFWQDEKNTKKIFKDNALKNTLAQNDREKFMENLKQKYFQPIIANLEETSLLKNLFTDLNTKLFRNLFAYQQLTVKDQDFLHILALIDPNINKKIKPQISDTNDLYLPEKINFLPNNILEQISQAITLKLSQPNLDEVINFYLEYFILRKNEHLNLQNLIFVPEKLKKIDLSNKISIEELNIFSKNTKTIPVNYILKSKTDPKQWSKIDGIEVPFVEQTQPPDTAKITHITLYDLTNIFNQKNIALKMISLGIYRPGSNQYHNYVSDIANMIIIAKIFLDKEK